MEQSLLSTHNEATNGNFEVTRSRNHLQTSPYLRETVEVQIARNARNTENRIRYTERVDYSSACQERRSAIATQCPQIAFSNARGEPRWNPDDRRGSFDVRRAQAGTTKNKANPTSAVQAVPFGRVNRNEKRGMARHPRGHERNGSLSPRRNRRKT